MAVIREDEKAALRRWQDLELLQKHYAIFDDFVVDVIEGVMGFTATDIQLDICDWLAYGPQYRMVQAQRSQAKTTLTAIYAVWRTIHDPTNRTLIISAGEDQAVEIANWIIQIINNMPELECMRPDRSAGDRASVEAYDVHYTLKGPEKSPSFACIGITANMQGKRADLLIADDVESGKNSQTATQRARLHHLTLDFTSICGKGDIVYLGTPQSIDSEYNSLPGRGYEIRIWPGRYPTPKEMLEYGGMVAPIVMERIAADPTLQTGGGPTGDRGKPVDPVMMNEEMLTKKEIDQGAAYFQLQYMLSTHLSDADRFPLKLGKIRFLSYDREERKGPMSVTHAAVDGNVIKLPAGMPIKDRCFRVHNAEDYSLIKDFHMYIDPSGGGQNGDELTYAITGFLAGRVFGVHCNGIYGGLGDEQIDFIVQAIDKWKPFTVSIEENFGKGAFSQVLRPRLKNHKPGIEDVWESGQKELRIIDTMEPIIGSGKLVMHEEMLHEDWEYCQKYPTALRNTYSLFWQMSRVTRDKGSLIHDDRLDAFAASCRFWTEHLAQDDEKARAKARDIAYREMMKNPTGTGRPMPGWHQFGVKADTNALAKHGLGTVNHLRRI